MALGHQFRYFTSYYRVATALEIMEKSKKRKLLEMILERSRGDIHTQLATDNVVVTFVGGWVFTCDIILVAVSQF